MISAVFTVKKISNVSLLLILALGGFLRLFKIGQAFPFDHDQEFAANAAYNFLVNQKLTLIGQELSSPGFFLGPIHNWILTVPYGICNLSPQCVPYFFITIGLATIVALYIIVRKILDQKTAIIAAAIYALSFTVIGFERGASSNFFLFLSSLAIFFSLYKYFSGRDVALPIGSFIAGLATVNFNPVFIFSTIAFFITSLIRKDRKVSVYLFSIATFLINYLPLIVFNFRHQNILWQSFENFLKHYASPLNFFHRLEYLASDVVMPFYANFFFNSTNLIASLLTIATIIFGLYKVVLTKNKFLFVLPIWLLVTLLGFSAYGGNISDYYFQQTLLAMVLLISIALAKNFLVFVIFMLLFAYNSVTSLVNYDSGINYQVKKQVVNYVVNDSQEETFNVYYDFPPGFNTGYDYLFKIASNQPTEGGRNLYVLELRDHTDILKYQNSFPDKKIDVVTIGLVNVVSVK